MKQCGNKANARINYGWKLKKEDAKEEEIKYFKSKWYCKDHFNNNLKKSFKNGTVKVEYPREHKTEEENLKEHIKNRVNDDYYDGHYRIAYKSKGIHYTGIQENV